MRQIEAVLRRIDNQKYVVVNIWDVGNSTTDHEFVVGKSMCLGVDGPVTAFREFADTMTQHTAVLN